MKKSVLCFVLMTILCSACKNNSSETNTSDSINKDTLKNTHFVSKEIQGLFEAKLPCADCLGISTKLVLNKDFTYILEQNYQGVKDTAQHVFYDLGHWNINDSTLTLSPKTSDTLKFHLSNDDTLKMLATNGDNMPDSIASKYALHRSNATFTQSQPALVNGILEKSGNTLTLTLCAWDKSIALNTTPKTLDPLNILWKKLKTSDAEKAIFQGEIKLTNNNTKADLIKTIGIFEGETCN